MKLAILAFTRDHCHLCGNDGTMFVEYRRANKILECANILLSKRNPETRQVMVVPYSAYDQRACEMDMEHFYEYMTRHAIFNLYREVHNA